jgi:hypothetical protein
VLAGLSSVGATAHRVWVWVWSCCSFEFETSEAIVLRQLVNAPHLRSAASTVRGMRAFGELSTASAGSAAAICPASSAAHACTAASAPADAWRIDGQSCWLCWCCWLLVACVLVLQVLRLFWCELNGMKVVRLEWQQVLLSCCPARDSSLLVMLSC